jgi:hypothetical protein
MDGVGVTKSFLFISVYDKLIKFYFYIHIHIQQFNENKILFISILLDTTWIG